MPPRRSAAAPAATGRVRPRPAPRVEAPALRAAGFTSRPGLNSAPDPVRIRSHLCPRPRSRARGTRSGLPDRPQWVEGGR